MNELLKNEELKFKIQLALDIIAVLITLGVSIYLLIVGSVTEKFLTVIAAVIVVGYAIYSCKLIPNAIANSNFKKQQEMQEKVEEFFELSPDSLKTQGITTIYDYIEKLYSLITFDCPIPKKYGFQKQRTFIMRGNNYCRSAIQLIDIFGVDAGTTVVTNKEEIDKIYMVIDTFSVVFSPDKIEIKNLETNQILKENAQEALNACAKK